LPIHTYTNWNKRPSDETEQIEPYRKYFFICEGANTETFYFEKLIDLRKQLCIHPLIDIRLMEKTGEDDNLSFPKHLVEFAELQKQIPSLNFDPDHDKMVIVFDADIFETKVKGYDELIERASRDNIIGVTNPGFELFLLLHVDNAIEKYIAGKENLFFTVDEKNRYSHALNMLRDATGMNAKKNRRIGELANSVMTAIEQEKKINQNIHKAHGTVTSNIGQIIEMIMNDSANT